MGISGLLPVLKPISQRTHVSKYAGQKVAIDAYSWLHKGAYACSQELCEGTYTDKYVSYCMQRIELLLGCGVVPVVVFDGDKLPMKADEESSRARGRQENLAKAQAFIASGNSSAAVECYQRAVDISPAAAKRFIEALKASRVEYIVAPYEADAQMAFLAISGQVSAVITEDSDLLAYGCNRVLFKMDKIGEGQEICLDDLGSNRGLSFVGFTPDMFLEMCIMAGCDFLKALPGIGMKKAYQHMRKNRTFLRACKNLRFSGTAVPRGYEAAFQRAVWTFRHQRVFDTVAGKIVHLHPIPDGGLVAAPGVVNALPEDDPDLKFLGPPLDDQTAADIARGDLDPITRHPFPAEAAPQLCQADYRPADDRVTGSLPYRRNIQNGLGTSRPVQKGLAAYFPSLGRTKGWLSRGSKSAPAQPAAHTSVPKVATSTDSEHRSHSQTLLGAPAVQAQRNSLPSRFLPALAGVSSASQTSSLENSSQEQPSQLPRQDCPEMLMRIKEPSVLKEGTAWQHSQPELESSMRTKCSNSWLRRALSTVPGEGADLLSSEATQLSPASLKPVPSGEQDFASFAVKSSLSEGGSDSGMVLGSSSLDLKQQLAESARFLQQEQAALSQDSLQTNSAGERDAMAANNIDLQPTAECSGLLQTESISIRQTTHRQQCLDLEESPSLSVEFGGASGGASTDLDWGQLPGGASGAPILHEQFYDALSPMLLSGKKLPRALDCAEKDRPPLSPINRRNRSVAKPAEAPLDSHKKQKISHFFGQTRKLQGPNWSLPDENSPTAQPNSPEAITDSQEADALEPLSASQEAAGEGASQAAGCPWQAFQCAEGRPRRQSEHRSRSLPRDSVHQAAAEPWGRPSMQPSELRSVSEQPSRHREVAAEAEDTPSAGHVAGTFHDLGHMRKYAATAVAVVDRLAGRSDLRKPFRVPRAQTAEASISQGVRQAGGRKSGRFSNFAFSSK